MNVLNADVLGVILKSLPVGQFLGTASVSKMFRKIIKKHVDTLRIWLTDEIRLRPMQAVLRDDFSKMQGIYAYRAPKDSGKTIAGYACATKATVIRASKNGLKVWIEEAKNLGWYNSNPALSKILIYHSVSKKHFDYIKTFPNDKKSAIILTTDNNFQAALGLLHKLTTPADRVVIIDEAHKLAGCQQFTGVSRVLLLSAEVIECRANKYVSVIEMQKVPEVIWDFLPMYVNASDGSAIPVDYGVKMQVIKSIRKQHRRLLVFATADEIKVLSSSDIFKHSMVFIQKTGVTTITKFNKYEGTKRAVIFINTAQSEAVNVYADGMIFYDAGRNNIQHDTQAIGRVLRSDNKVKDNKVTVHLMCFNDTNLLRSAATRCFSSELWKFSYEGLPRLPYLEKCGAMIRILTGSSVLDVNKQDGCLLFHNYSSFPIDEDTLVKWWIANATDTKLTEAMVRSLCL